VNEDLHSFFNFKLLTCNFNNSVHCIYLLYYSVRRIGFKDLITSLSPDGLFLIWTAKIIKIDNLQINMLFFNESGSIIDRAFIHFFIPCGKYKGGICSAYKCYVMLYIIDGVMSIL
jgi:hypothetical protein